MPEEKNICETCNHCIQTPCYEMPPDPAWKYCPRCGKPLEEKWEPEYGKCYFYIDAFGKVESTLFNEFHAITPKCNQQEALKELRRFNNLFFTREAAEKHLAMVKCVDSQRELPERGEFVLTLEPEGIKRNHWYGVNPRGYHRILWRLGFAQPDTPEGRALLEKNIRERKEWFE